MAGVDGGVEWHREVKDREGGGGSVFGEMRRYERKGLI